MRLFPLASPVPRHLSAFTLVALASLAGCGGSSSEETAPASTPATSGAEAPPVAEDPVAGPAAAPPVVVPEEVAARSLVELYDLGVQDMLSEDWGRAAEWLRYAYQRSPHPTTLLALGAAEGRAGWRMDAIATFEAFVAAYPDHPHVGAAQSAIAHLRAGAPSGVDFRHFPSNPYLP